MSENLSTMIPIWRAKALDGTITIDEMKAAIVVLRGGRVSASIASDKSRTAKAKVSIPSADDLLAELGGL